MDDRLAKQGTEQVFRALEAELRGEDSELYPTRWIDVAAYDPAAQLWIVKGLDLLLRNAATAGPDFDGVRASSLLVDRAPERRFDPTISGERFTYEILTLSGWLETALPAGLTVPAAPALTRLGGIYRPPAAKPFDPDALTAALLPALTERLTEQRTWWADSAEADDPMWLADTARAVQAFVRDSTGLFTGACADGPLNEGFAYDQDVAGASARPDDDTSRLTFLRQQVHLLGRAELVSAGYDHTRMDEAEALDDLLRDWLTDDISLNDLVGDLLGHSPAHRNGPAGWIYLPERPPGAGWGPREAWRPYVYRLMMHELVHRLAHARYIEAVDMVADPQILAEGVVDLLTCEFLELSRSHPELGALVPEDGSVGYGASGQAAAQISDLVGPDNVKAAFFLGRVEFLGISL
ncbi:hypothetical protein [Nonomuraea helvata]|uniref:Uncharacterized protein n=1 Tax=Nonomuraea helvata TaxID=37484 RepID=A0ABV5SCH1_9ACTN